MKKLLFFALGFLALAAAGLTAASWWAMRQLKPAMWVELAEKNWNCRAELANAELSLLTKPATLKLVGIRLAPRDEQVALPYEQRTPLPADAAVLDIPQALMEVKLDDLMNRRLFVEKLRLVSPVVREIQDTEGKSSLSALFKKPGSQEAEEATPKVAPAPPKVESEASKDDPVFAFAMHAASIEKGRAEITSGTTRVNIDNLDFTVTGIDVDKANLAEHNLVKALLSCQVQVNGLARIGGAQQPAQLANLNLTGESEITPYNAQTQEWKPFSKLKLTLAQGSTIAGHMTLGDAAGKDLRKLQEYGVDLAPVVIGGPLTHDAIVVGEFANDRFITRSQTRFVFPEYTISIEPKSWVNAAQDKHEMEFRLICGPELQKRLTDGISSAGLGESLTRGVTKALADKDGRMTFDMESKGPLSKPKVEPKVDRVLKNLMRGEGLGDLLQGLMKKL